MNKTLTILINTALLAALPASSLAAAKSIYGTDNRIEYFQATPAQQQLAASVVSLWKASDVEAAGANFKLKTRNVGQAARMCPGVRFSEQPTGAFCGGALVGEDLVLTAGHCIYTEAECKATKFVFGYQVPAKGKAAVTAVEAGAVYGCGSVVKRYLDTEHGSAKGADYALIKLDRKVAGRQPLAISNTAISKDAQIFVLGYPLGMPLKAAGGARVRDAAKNGFFNTDLDTFGKNSGSPVFNAKNNLLEGVVVRGSDDFTYTPAGCTVMTVYEQDGGSGEDVTRISQIAAQIPQAAAAPELLKSGSQQSETLTRAAAFY